VRAPGVSVERDQSTGPWYEGEAPRCYVGGCEGYRYGVAIAQGLCISTVMQEHGIGSNESSLVVGVAVKPEAGRTAEDLLTEQTIRPSPK